MGFANGFFVKLELRGFQAQRFQTQRSTAVIEHPDNHFFAKLGRQCAHPEVDLVILGQPQFHAAVLGYPPLGDIQA